MAADNARLICILRVFEIGEFGVFVGFYKLGEKCSIIINLIAASGRLLLFVLAYFRRVELCIHGISFIFTENKS